MRSLKYLILSCVALVSFLQSDILRKSWLIYFFLNPLIQYHLHNKWRFTHPAQEGNARRYGCFFTTDFWISDLGFILVTPAVLNFLLPFEVATNLFSSMAAGVVGSSKEDSSCLALQKPLDSKISQPVPMLWRRHLTLQNISYDDLILPSQWSFE